MKGERWFSEEAARTAPMPSGSSTQLRRLTMCEKTWRAPARLTTRTRCS
ncbi:hypothetical protein X753_13920 [Mesorhizobium sp. LNJC399B00]|nr:hypothetical protein X753_13920 [Mesorhizobium sp. LNJC399B00]